MYGHVVVFLASVLEQRRSGKTALRRKSRRRSMPFIGPQPQAKNLM